MKFDAYFAAVSFSRSETWRTGIKHKVVKTFYYSIGVGCEKYNDCWTVCIR